jgi:hypothetical protein
MFISRGGGYYIRIYKMKNIWEYFNLKWLELVAFYLFLEGGYLGEHICHNHAINFWEFNDFGYEKKSLYH